ncbi:YbaN family protein|nr:YbaN family protein [Dendrosporobacter quercicolus DSM 1736]
MDKGGRLTDWQCFLEADRCLSSKFNLREVVILETGSIKKTIFMVVGCLSLALGMTGIFLPLLPTTPFLLLAAYCFMQSSTRLYNWLIQHKVFGKYIYNYLTHRAVEAKAKRLALVFLWGTIAISLYLLPNIYIRLLLFAVGSGVSFHILTLKEFK